MAFVHNQVFIKNMTFTEIPAMLILFFEDFTVLVDSGKVGSQCKILRNCTHTHYSVTVTTVAITGLSLHNVVH